MYRKIYFATDNWDKFKAALEEICLISHPVFKRQWEVFRCQSAKERLPDYIARVANSMDVAHLEDGLTKDTIGVLAVMVGLFDQKVRQKIVENFQADSYTMAEITGWANRQEAATATYAHPNKASLNTITGSEKPS